MSEENIKCILGKVFNNLADTIETGEFGEKIKIGITLLGSEHGIYNIVKGAEMAQQKDSSLEVILIGPEVETDLKIYPADTQEKQHKKMEELLDMGEIQAAVTMHYNFPIGVSTIGRVVTPGKGKEMLIATTTGTSSVNRTEGMVKNAIYGIITAKTIGIQNPTIGILNVDGARQVERALKELNSNGYNINFAESIRKDGGCIMRGNDLLTATPDIMVSDSLTGNLLMKVFSSYTTGGDYEAIGYGYGPGIGKGYQRNILILSRASGEPVIANAILYATQLVRGKIMEVSKKEFERVKKANLQGILRELKKDVKKEKIEEVKMPSKEVVAASIAGIDILELEDAVKMLWKNGIYAESGMGCTGPIVMVSERKQDQAIKILSQEGYITQRSGC